MGGHSVYWETMARARVLVPKPKNDQTDLHFWAILDLGKSHYQIVAGGMFDGLASIIVPKAQHWVVKRRAERDSILPGPTRRVNFDCMACASCCRANEVVLEPEDHARFERTRPELARRPFAKRRADGKVVLVLLRNKNCKHLADDNRCNIYELRPNACRSFPVGSESCMYAREEELGLHDGLPPEGVTGQ
jgi:Fe-S-cluster containining protein